MKTPQNSPENQTTNADRHSEDGSSNPDVTWMKSYRHQMEDSALLSLKNNHKYPKCNKFEATARTDYRTHQKQNKTNTEGYLQLHFLNKVYNLTADVKDQKGLAN